MRRPSYSMDLNPSTGLQRDIWRHLLVSVLIGRSYSVLWPSICCHEMGSHILFPRSKAMRLTLRKSCPKQIKQSPPASLLRTVISVTLSSTPCPRQFWNGIEEQTTASSRVGMPAIEGVEDIGPGGTYPAKQCARPRLGHGPDRCDSLDIESGS
ncbi:hypothetical protein CDD83_7583 [Cordyceps sp. RAO-2017]|nr:hypothetical protein CDD83_7583 [Cordyceps sp. RAO-2017]